MFDGITLDQIRTVLAVAELGSFRAAAQQRGCVASAVSQVVGQCEAQLGIKLFDRSTYRASATAQGRQLLEDMRLVSLGVQTLKARAKAMAAGVEPQLQLALDPLFPLPILSTAIADLRKDNPTVSIKILSEMLGGPTQLVRNNQASIGLSASAEIAESGIVRESIGWILMYAVVAREFPTSFAVHEDFNSLVFDAVQIVVSDPTAASAQRDFGVISPRTWRVSDLSVKRQLILDGHGWGGLPAWMIAQDLKDGRLRKVAPPGYGVDGCTLLECACLYRADQPLGPLGSTLMRLLRNRVELQASDFDLRTGLS